MESIRGQLERLIGTKIGDPPALRMLWFPKRSGFDAFLRPLTVQISHLVKNVYGLYLRQPRRIVTICDQELPYFVAGPDKSIGSLFCFTFAESFPAGAPAIWVQTGIARWLTAADDDLVRLNRRMLASLSKGTTFGVDLFGIDNKDVFKLINGWDEHRNFAKYQRFDSESWSVLAYLIGESAPEERRANFRAFLADAGAKAQPAKAFERHFGYRFDRLVADWREWVLAQGIGAFAPAPPRVEERLVNRVIPLVEDRQADRAHRILAIRNMGSNGYLPGADALIGLLGNDDAIPKEEVIWALEAISGTPHGDDPDRWRAWWNTLAVERTDLTADEHR
jgi:hypothetical protein